MLAFPGGAYRFHSRLSSADYGMYFASQGITVMAVYPRLGSQGFDGRAFCADALAAVKGALARAANWGIDPEKIGVIGTSAGGHLAAMLSTGASEWLLRDYRGTLHLPLEWRPEFALFCYAVLSLEPPLRHNETAYHFLGPSTSDTRAQYSASPLNHIDRRHCRSFLWHTAEDAEVSVDNTLEMYTRLRACGVPAELHIYEKGPHALGLARELKGNLMLHWPEEAVRWITSSSLEPVVSPTL
jgi:acetyl esterase/lipase